MATERAHAAGSWIGICGELVADDCLTQAFLEMGIDELSVVPGAILSLQAGIVPRVAYGKTEAAAGCPVGLRGVNIDIAGQTEVC